MGEPDGLLSMELHRVGHHRSNFAAAAAAVKLIYIFLVCLLLFVGKKVAKQEDLKEMGDVSSGMSSSIMQLYLKQVLEAFFHTQSSVRHFALNVIALTLNQGLIHPVQVSMFYISSTYGKSQEFVATWRHCD